MPAPSTANGERPVRFASAVYLGTFLLLLFTAGVAVSKEVPVTVFLRDPNALAGSPFYTGALSSLGVLLWGAAATVCFLGASVLREPLSGRGLRPFLLGAGAFTILLMLDDLFLVHEAVVPRYLGLQDSAVYAGYAGLAATLALRFRRTILTTRYSLLLLSVALLAGSVGFDVLEDVFGVEGISVSGLNLNYLVEDGLKLLGIAGWLVYLGWTARHSLAPRPVAGSGERRSIPYTRA
jgi:hypothetical protein